MQEESPQDDAASARTPVSTHSHCTTMSVVELRRRPLSRWKDAVDCQRGVWQVTGVSLAPIWLVSFLQGSPAASADRQEKEAKRAEQAVKDLHEFLQALTGVHLANVEAFLALKVWPVLPAARCRQGP